MERQSVNSSQLKSVGHEDGVLEIEFSNGAVYQYQGSKVKDHYDGLMAANAAGESVGRYFNQNIRKCPHTSYGKVK